MGRRLLHRRLAPLTLRCHAVLAVVSNRYPPPMDRYLRVTHPSATEGCPSVRLACVKHAASVRSEPGSNSQVHQTSQITSQPNEQDPISQTSVPQATRPTEHSKRLSTHSQDTSTNAPRPRNRGLNPNIPTQPSQHQSRNSKGRRQRIPSYS